MQFQEHVFIKVPSGITSILAFIWKFLQITFRRFFWKIFQGFIQLFLQAFFQIFFNQRLSQQFLLKPKPFQYLFVICRIGFCRKCFYEYLPRVIQFYQVLYIRKIPENSSGIPTRFFIFSADNFSKKQIWDFRVCDGKLYEDFFF